MTHSTSASDPSPSHTQPQSDPPVFQPRCVMCHTVSHDLVPPPMYVHPPLLTSPACDFIYKSHLYSENKLA